MIIILKNGTQDAQKIFDYIEKQGFQTFTVGKRKFSIGGAIILEQLLVTSRCKKNTFLISTEETPQTHNFQTLGYDWVSLVPAQQTTPFAKGLLPGSICSHRNTSDGKATQHNPNQLLHHQTSTKHTHARTDRKNDARVQFGWLRPTCTHAQTCKRRCNLGKAIICATYRARRKINMNAPARCVHAMKRLQRRYPDSSMIQGTAIFGVCKRLLRTHIQQSHNNHSCKLVSRSHADQRAIEVLGAKPAHTNQPETVNILICWQTSISLGSVHFEGNAGIKQGPSSCLLQPEPHLLQSPHVQAREKTCLKLKKESAQEPGWLLLWQRSRGLGRPLGHLTWNTQQGT